MLRSEGQISLRGYGSVAYRQYGRSGTHSVPLLLLQLGGRWITPYEQRRRGIRLSLSNLLTLAYGPVLRELVYARNPFLSLIPKKDDGFAGTYIPVPLATYTSQPLWRRLVGRLIGT